MADSGSLLKMSDAWPWQIEQSMYEVSESKLAAQTAAPTEDPVAKRREIPPCGDSGHRYGSQQADPGFGQQTTGNAREEILAGGPAEPDELAWLRRQH